MILNRNQIIGAVKTIKAALGKDNDYYIKDGYIIAQNSESIAKVKVEGLSENFRLPAKAIPLLSAMGEEIEAKITAGAISFKSGKSKANYKITDIPDSLLDTGNFKGDHSINIDSEIINNAVSKLFNIVALNTTRPVLTGMYINIENDNVVFTASDGYRVARYREQIKNDDVFECIVPRNTLNIISAMGFEGNIVISINDNWITISDEDENKIIHSRLIEGDYLKVDAIFNNTQELMYKVSKSLVLGVIDRTKIVTGKIAEIGITLDNDAKVEYTGDDEYSETFNIIESCGEKCYKKVNLSYLRDAVAALFEDSVSLYTNEGPNTPFIFRDKKVESLVLPINR